MIDQLKKLKDTYGVEGVKAEFEAEGTRTEELMRLRELTLHADISFTLKIGGCEALRDMYDAKSIGIQHMVGPMIETSFALEKYMNAINAVYSPEEQAEIEFLFNVETIETVRNWENIVSSSVFSRSDGVVLGRGDLVESLGMPRSSVDSEAAFDHCRNILVSTKAYGKTTVMGGSVTAASIPFIRRLPEGCLDRYETRKVCFRTELGLKMKPEEGIAQALDFELMWMENKRNYYTAISREDNNRIEALQKRKQ